MNEISRRRFLTGAPTVVAAAVVGRLAPKPEIEDDRRDVLERHLKNVEPGTPLGGATDVPSLTEWSRAVDRALLDLSPKETR